MSLKLGNTTIAGISRETKLNAHSLLDFKWTDHILNEMSWLRADTFSWQSGDVYTSVYNLLVAEYQNGTEETEGSITFKRSPNGYKITTDESGVSALFNETGVAWFYILDTENRRFKLPRSKYNAYASQIAVKGNGMTVGWTDNTNNYGMQATTVASSSFATSIYGTPTGSASGTIIATNKSVGITTDPTKSGIVADLPTQELHLYFYVGEFSQTATEQTAGLNTELFNGKLDLNASGLSTQGKSLISGLGMPSNRYIDLTLGASGTEYTAPANGWFWFTVQTTSSQSYFAIVNLDNNMRDGKWTTIATANVTSYMPVKKGQKVTVSYSNATPRQNENRFIYAEGEN